MPSPARITAFEGETVTSAAPTTGFDPLPPLPFPDCNPPQLASTRLANNVARNCVHRAAECFVILMIRPRSQKPLHEVLRWCRVVERPRNATGHRSPANHAAMATRI